MTHLIRLTNPTRLTIAVTLALVAVLSLAGTASGADTETQNVDADVDSSITISTTDAFSPVSFGLLSVGDNAVDAGVLTVESNEDYQVLVEGDADRMTDSSTSETLAQPLRVGEVGGLGLSEAQITIGQEVFADTTGLTLDLTTATDYDLELRQEHESTDPTGTYSMVATYTATTDI